MKDEDLTRQIRRKKLIDALPPLEQVLRGSVFLRSIRCGKPTCHCASGEPHQVAYLTTTFPGGRTEQISLPPDLALIAKQWVRTYKLWWKAIEELSAINRQVLRQLRRSKTSTGRRRKRNRSTP